MIPQPLSSSQNPFGVHDGAMWQLLAYVLNYIHVEFSREGTLSLPLYITTLCILLPSPTSQLIWPCPRLSKTTLMVIASFGYSTLGASISYVWGDLPMFLECNLIIVTWCYFWYDALSLIIS